ncbi:balbiani ring protein 3-like [Pantherophis guttatus]|uniref:Balbiani ring protein 3-like n=1 Tax=Pantherophis guttatus TaxID=94885 RepID=A0ABM3ZPI0_PANGU|nr:balbiani ring protein 3-like [Pantherophis guttatus]
MKSQAFWLLVGMVTSTAERGRGAAKGASPDPFRSQEPVPGKAGRCPAGSAQEPLPSRLYCLSDASCPGGKKCCSLGRMRICTQPALVNPGYCPTACPTALEPCRVSCLDDVACGPGEKCCLQDCQLRCVVAERVRPGLCPRRRVLPTGTPCPNRCEDDRGCPPGQKCCFTGCGLECLRPRAEDPAVCTDPPTAKCQDRCRDDSDCAKEEKCRPTACGFQCQGPPPGKPGVCPLLLRGSLGPCVGKTLRNCTHDFDCEEAKKCCSNGCRMVCKEPGEDNIVLRAKGQQVEQQTPEPPTNDPSGQKQQGKTGPPTNGQCPPTILINATEVYCSVNRRCPGDEKCCQIGNTVKCVYPKGVNHGYCPRPQDQAIYKKPCVGDHQCGWHEKCCRTGGQKKCVAAVPAAPGLCPKRRLPLGYTPCRDQCNDDRRCSSGKKCCFHECGLKCVDPERPHQEDQDQEQDQEQNQDQKTGKDGGDTKFPGESKGECDRDRDCPPRKKCCAGTCRRECQPQGICQLPQKKGPCKAYMSRWFYNRHKGKCEHFIYGGCPGNANNFKTLQECDLRCVLPDINKPGTCPTPLPAEDAVSCRKYCSNDASCPGSERCCATPCGRQECEIPRENLPGYCPVLLLPPSTGDVCFPNCTNDLDCNHGVNFPWKKCCIFDGRKICVDAVEEHPGVCPRRVEVQTLVPCNNTCNDDHDCHLTEKCCFTGCSRGCLPSDPVGTLQLGVKEPAPHTPAAVSSDTLTSSAAAAVMTHPVWALLLVMTGAQGAGLCTPDQTQSRSQSGPSMGGSSKTLPGSAPGRFSALEVTEAVASGAQWPPPLPVIPMPNIALATALLSAHLTPHPKDSAFTPAHHQLHWQPIMHCIPEGPF